MQQGKGKGIEYEYKFLEIDITKTRKLLKKLGGKLVHKRMQYIRKVYLRCNQPNIKGFARVRQEDKNVTMTVKVYPKENPKFPIETEVELSESQTFEDGTAFMLALGLNEKAFQETYREKWSIPSMKDVHEVTFDEWPGLPVYCEIDCKTEKALEKTIDLLQLRDYKKRAGASALTYQEYYNLPTKVLNNHTPSLSFANIEKEIQAALRYANKNRKSGSKRIVNKNKDLLKKIATKQKKY